MSLRLGTRRDDGDLRHDQTYGVRTDRRRRGRRVRALLLVALMLVGCAEDPTVSPRPSGQTATVVSAPSSSPPPTDASTRCPTASPPQFGECTVVDWDVVAVDGASLVIEVYLNAPGCAESVDRVGVEESDESVTLMAVARFSGGNGVSCPTAIASTAVQVELESALGGRTLLGCRPDDSFAPAGGYPLPAPREDIDCQNP